MKIFIESPNSSRYPLSDVSPTQSIRELKMKIQQKEKIAPDDQTLSFCHKPLLDTKRLDDYNIKEGTTLVLGLKLRGGSDNNSDDLKEIPVKPSKKPAKINRTNSESVLKQTYSEKLIPKGYRDLKHMQESYLAEINKRQEKFAKEHRTGYRIHTRPVYGVIVSKVHNIFVTSHDDGSIKIFNLETQSLIRSLDKFHAGPIRCLAVSKDEKYLATGGDDKKIKFVEIETFHAPREIKCDTYSQKGPLSLSFSNDGKFLICGLERSVRVYNIEMGGVSLFGFENIHGAETSVAISQDDKYIFTASRYDKCLKVFDLQTGQDVHTYEDFADYGTFSLATSDNNKYIAAGVEDGAIIIFDMKSRERISTFKSQESAICSLRFTHDSKYLISGDALGVIRIFSMEINQMIHCDSQSHHGGVNSIDMANDDSVMISVSNDHSFQSHRLQVEPTIMKIYSEEFDSLMCAIVPCQNGTKYFAGMTAGKLKLFDFESHREVEEIETGLRNVIHALALTKDEKMLIYVSSENVLKIYDLENKTEVYCSAEPERTIVCMENLALLDDEKKIAAVLNDGTIDIFDFASKELLQTFGRVDEEGVRQYRAWTSCFTHDKNHVIFGSYQDVHITNLKTQQITCWIKEIHDNNILSLAVTSDDKYLILPGANKTIKILCLKTQEIEYTFTDAHKGINITALLLFHNDKYLASASTDNAIKIFDLETKQVVYRFDDVFERGTQTLSFINNKLMATAKHKSSIKLLNLPFLKEDQDFYHSSKVSPYQTVGEFEKLLLNLKEPSVRNDILIAYQDLYFTPHNWNILHFLSILDNHVISTIPSYADLKVPFLVDKYGKTPLHYLIAHESIDFLAVNSMLKYILDYLEERGQQDSNAEYRAVTGSLSEIAPFILTKTNPSLVERFLKLCFISSPTVYNFELPRFGDAETKYTFSTEAVVETETFNKIYQNGQEMISFQTLMLRLDYKATSDDMLDMALTLNSIKGEELFRCPAISNLIQHLWENTQSIRYINTILFTILIAIISVYIGSNDRLVPLEVIIVVLSAIFLLSEAIQFKSFKIEYFYRFWNWADIIFHVFVIAVMITRFCEMDRDLLTKWLLSIVVLCGYTRLASHLRLFTPTRNLIQLILVVLRDMWAFGLIVLLIVLGFALIFLVFEREGTYLDYFYGSYVLLYGNYDDSTYSPSQKIFLSVILLIFSVVLLNLLVSIMGDSYEKVQEKRATIDSLTKLEIILEALVLKRMFSTNKSGEKGYLIFCGASQEEEEGDQQTAEWEGRINLIKKLLKSNDAKVERVDQRLNKFEGRITTLEEELRHMKSTINDNHYEVMRTLRDIKSN